MAKVKSSVTHAWSAPCGRFAKRLSVIAFFLPLVQAVGPTDGAADAWKILAGAAVGALATAFVAGRNAVTRPDVTALRAELILAIDKGLERCHERIDKIGERAHEQDARIREIADKAQAAIGMRELVQIALKKSTENDRA